MSKIKWDEVGEKFYETGVRNGVLYPQDNEGGYASGVGWNGLTEVTESPEGGEVTTIYADDGPYMDLVSKEKLKFTIGAYQSPEEFDVCDGTAEVIKGVKFGQQSRKKFGFSYVSTKGNDVEQNDYGYRIHLIYNCLASPSEKSHTTINDSPEASNPSWSVSASPVNVPGYSPTSSVVIESKSSDPAKLAILESVLYGKDHELTKTEPKDWATNYKKYFTKDGTGFVAVTGDSAPEWTENKYYDDATEPRLPLPKEVIEIMGSI